VRKKRKREIVSIVFKEKDGSMRESRIESLSFFYLSLFLLAVPME
jgi:hypothetical protein